jgi:hypothetical protein
MCVCVCVCVYVYTCWNCNKKLPKICKYQFLISNFHVVLNVLCFLLGDRRRLKFIYRRFETPCSLPPVKMQQTGCSEILAYKLQTPTKINMKNLNFYKGPTKLPDLNTDLTPVPVYVMFWSHFISRSETSYCLSWKTFKVRFYNLVISHLNFYKF